MTVTHNKPKDVTVRDSTMIRKERKERKREVSSKREKGRGERIKRDPKRNIGGDIQD